jgi:hypothetical protein
MQVAGKRDSAKIVRELVEDYHEKLEVSRFPLDCQR